MSATTGPLPTVPATPFGLYNVQRCKSSVFGSGGGLAIDVPGDERQMRRPDMPLPSTSQDGPRLSILDMFCRVF